MWKDVIQNTLNHRLAHHQVNSCDHFPLAYKVFVKLVELIFERVVKSRSDEEAFFHIQMFTIFLLTDQGALRFDDVETFKNCHFEKALIKVNERRMSADDSGVYRVLESIGFLNHGKQDLALNNANVCGERVRKKNVQPDLLRSQPAFHVCRETL